jgi:hypothetical protein
MVVLTEYLHAALRHAEFERLNKAAGTLIAWIARPVGPGL